MPNEAPNAAMPSRIAVMTARRSWILLMKEKSLLKRTQPALAMPAALVSTARVMSTAKTHTSQGMPRPMITAMMGLEFLPRLMMSGLTGM